MKTLKHSFLPSCKDLKVIVLKVGEHILRKLFSHAFNKSVNCRIYLGSNLTVFAQIIHFYLVTPLGISFKESYSNMTKDLYPEMLIIVIFVIEKVWEEDSTSNNKKLTKVIVLVYHGLL